MTPRHVKDESRVMGFMSPSSQVTSGQVAYAGEVGREAAHGIAAGQRAASAGDRRPLAAERRLRHYRPLCVQLLLLLHMRRHCFGVVDVLRPLGRVLLMLLQLLAAWLVHRAWRVLAG